MQHGDQLTLDIEKPVAGGRMLARHNGQVVLVWGAIPGERVRASVDRATPRLAFATTIDVLAASADRREAPGDWRCGGNVYAHIHPERQRALKSLIVRDAFARIARLTLDTDLPVEPSIERGYRMRARLHARGGAIGFFREGTHELCDPVQAGQLLDSSVDALRALQDILARGAVPEPQSIDLSENVPATERAIHLELPRGGRLPDAALFAGTGLAAGVSAAAGADAVTKIVGEPYVSDELDLGFGRVRLRRHARAFFQGNRYLLATLVSRVIGQVPAGEDVLDLYAGGGLFSVPLAARGGSRVTAVEGDAAAGDDLKWNGRLYGKTLRTYRRAVESHLKDRPAWTGTILVDPPRTGMSAEATTRIRSSGARRIVYVSCDVATLARDAGSLIDAGYHLVHAEAFDLFPNTAHIETLAVFARRP